VVQDPATLSALKKRSLVLLAILLPAVVLTFYLVATDRRPKNPPTVAENSLPLTITTADRVWTSNRMTFSELEMAILETRDYLYRTYTDGRGSPVDLCIVFSEDNRKGTHPPDVCLEAGGATISERLEREVTIDGQPLKVRELITTRVGSADQQTYFAYFYKAGDSFTPSFYGQQVQIIWNGLTRQNTAGAMIRYSTPMKKSELVQARARVDELISITVPRLKEKLNAAR
jgi:EpsI family protein